MENKHLNLKRREDSIGEIVARWRREYPRPSPDTPLWILPPLSCRLLEELCNLLTAPREAFEFGSGRSTHILRASCESVTSIEDSSEWLNKTETMDGGSEIRDQDLTQVVPLTRCWSQGRPIDSFAVEEYPEVVEKLKSASFILIDSPPNPAKREHALYLALQYAPVGSIIALDDLNVKAVERFARRLARQNVRSLAFWLLPFDHKIGIFFKRSNTVIKSAPTLREYIGAWMRAQK